VTAGRVCGKMACPKDKINGLAKNRKKKIL
jgi:hypothetical protein